MTTISLQAYRQLLASLGPQAWWPAESPLEVMLGAILVQNTAWKNVERALDHLRDADLLNLSKLLALELETLEELIRPAGSFRIKAKRLQSLLHFLAGEFDGSLEAMIAREHTVLRKQLLDVHGIGPETADSILLYALEKPALVVDAYTHRIYARHGWIDYQAKYHQLQNHIANELPRDVPTYNEFHALMVHVGHHYCRKTPHCIDCPLFSMLPEGGVVCATQ